MKTITIKQDDQKPVPVEILAESIKTIAQGIRRLRQGPLNDRALVLLIQYAAPTSGKYQARKIGISEIKAVFEGIDRLEAEYLRKKKV